MDCLAEANTRRQRLETPSFEPAPVALAGDICAGTVSVQFPVSAKTGFLSILNKIRITSDYKSDFDTIIHEYGHHEMWESYGKSLFGDYSRTQGEHNINGEVGDLWTAFNEGWADFCAVITKGRPEYRRINIEGESAGYVKSDRCEGTICRIFWDVWDTYEDPLFELDGDTAKAIPRPRQGWLTLDDDPIGYSPELPFIGWQGRKTLKKLINDCHPKRAERTTPSSWDATVRCGLAGPTSAAPWASAGRPGGIGGAQHPSASSTWPTWRPSPPAGRARWPFARTAPSGAGEAIKRASWASTTRPRSKPPSASARSTCTTRTDFGKFGNYICVT